MHSRMKALFIISCLGVILSITAAIYESVHYMAVSHSARAVQAIAPSDDIIATRIDTLLVDFKEKDLILNEIKARHKQASSFHVTLTNMLADSKANSLGGALLWFGTTIVFSILAIRLDAIRRSEKVGKN